MADPRYKGTFAEQLEAALSEKEVTRMEMARRLAGPGADDQKVRTARRKLYKWLAGTVPAEASVDRIAAALNVDRGRFSLPPAGPRPRRDRTAELERRLEALEAKVDREGRATRQAVEALEQLLAGRGVQRPPRAPSASRRGRAADRAGS